jgi:hypothetical protein
VIERNSRESVFTHEKSVMVLKASLLMLEWLSIGKFCKLQGEGRGETSGVLISLVLPHTSKKLMK